MRDLRFRDYVVVFVGIVVCTAFDALKRLVTREKPDVYTAERAAAGVERWQRRDLPRVVPASALQWEGAEVLTDAELHALCTHPDWEYATTEGPRKQWDFADVPPDGEGWEPNVDRGQDGWERFDYTEEAYWRRHRGRVADAARRHYFDRLADGTQEKEVF